METVVHAHPWHQYTAWVQNTILPCRHTMHTSKDVVACCQVMHMDPHEFTELEKVEPPDGVPEASTSQPSASTGNADGSYTCLMYMLILRRILEQVHHATRTSLRFSCVTLICAWAGCVFVLCDMLYCVYFPILKAGQLSNRATLFKLWAHTLQPPVPSVLMVVIIYRYASRC